ncbi:MAG: hypothetical protein JWO87_1589, partial [Phycisphaerales bacterium]|nr:hypothetical protein [Phycisphaerales bacterium]
MSRKSRSARLGRAAAVVVEHMETRLLFSALAPSNSVLVFNASVPGFAGGGVPSHIDTLTLTNTGAAPLALSSITIVQDPADPANESANFAIVNSGSLPASLAAGASTQVQLDYTATTANNIQRALLQIQTNDPTTPTTNIELHGLGTNGFFGTAEPSLVNILRANDIPTIVGAGPNDVNASNSQYPITPDPSSEEIRMPRLIKAGPGPVTITPLASFNSAVQPSLRIGYYNPGDPNSTTELFTVAKGDAQTVNPTALGANAFDPGANTFGLYGVFPGTSTPNGQPDIHYSEDSFNTLDTAHPRKFRFFPMKNPDGSVVANAFVIAAEDYNSTQFNSFTNFVGIIRNVTAAPGATGAPVLGLTNPAGVPSSDRLIFSRIQSRNTQDPAGFVDSVHDTGTLTINNSGDTPLVINGLTLSDSANWQLVSPPAAGTSIAPGGSLTLTIKFVAQTFPPGLPYSQINDTAPTDGTPPLQAGGVWNGTLAISTNDPANPTRTVQLAGYWQKVSEHETEPGTQTLTNLLLGYATNINSTEQPVYPNNGTQTVPHGEEVLSPYWQRADSGLPVTVLQFAGFNSQYDLTVTPPVATTPKTFWFAQGSSTKTALFTRAAGWGQTVLPSPTTGAGKVMTASFSPATAFGFNVDLESSDDSLNLGNSVIQANHRSGHQIRFYPVRDGAGNLVPNTWLMYMDYGFTTFENFDYQDNGYIITNMRPATQAPAPQDIQAVGVAGAVSIQWQPVTDATLTGYNVYRSSSPNGTFTKLNGSPIGQAGFVDSSAVGGQPNYYRISAVDTSGESQMANAQAQPLNSISGTLTSLDINSAVAGSTTVVTPGTAFTVTGAGGDIGGSQADGLRFVSEQVSGNFDAVVQVSSLSQNVLPNSRAGLMVRESLDAGSRMVFSGATASNGYRFNYRSTVNQIGIFNTVGTVAYPNVWVRLVRQGNQFTTFSSADGTHWSQTGSVELALANTLYLGMAVSSHSATSPVTAQFQGFNVAGGQTDPAPAAPTNLQTSATPSRITLSWAAAVGATSYTVKRLGPGDPAFTQVATGITGTTFVDSNVIPNATYQYVVISESAAGSSPASAPVSQVVPLSAPATPTNLVADGSSGTQVALTWTASPNADSYDVERLGPGDNNFVQIATGLTAAAFTDSSVTPGATYQYAVRADNTGGSSPFSNSVSATLPQKQTFDATIGKGAAKFVRFMDVDGTVTTIRLTGPGTATVHFAADTISETTVKGALVITGTNVAAASISTTNTTAGSALTITAAGGNGAVTIGGITVNGSLKSITGKNTNLVGDLEAIGSLGKVLLGSISNGAISVGGANLSLQLAAANNISLTSAGAIKSIQAGTWNSTGVISAPSIVTIKILHDATMAISAGAVRTLTVGGTLANSMLTLTAPGARDLTSFKAGALSNTQINSTGNL